MRSWIVVCVLLLPTLAQADLRVWEQGVDESGELQNPHEHRFVDVMGLAQPALALRFRDSEFGGYATSPQVRRMRIGIHAQPIWWVRMMLEVEVGFEAIRLQDGYLELRPTRYLRLTAGRFRVGLTGPGRFHESNLAFVERPAYTELLAIRQDGFRVHGEVGSDDSVSPTFQYALSVFAANDFAEGELKGVGLALDLRLHFLGVPEGAEEENDRARNSRPRLALGGTLYSNCQSTWQRGFGTDIEFRAFGLYVSGGYFWYTSGPANGSFGYEECGESLAADPSRNVHSGGHVQVQYVLPEVLFPVPRQALEVLARLDYIDPRSPYDSGRPLRGGDSELVPLTTFGASRYGLTVGLTWWATPNGWLRLQLNYRHEFETEDVMVVDGELLSSPRNDVLWLQLQGKL